MKHVKFLAAATAVAGTLFLASCNSGGDSKDQPATDTSAAKTDTMAAAPVANPIMTSPIQILTIKHKVANYAKWKIAYDAHDSARLANGLHNYIVARGTEDSNMVMVAMKFDDVAKAKAWAASPELKKRMAAAGVVGPTSTELNVTVMMDTTALTQMDRVMVKHKVKDWTAWKKAFDDHKPARVAAGLLDRVVGHSVDDDKSVVIVLGVTDMAKAKAFMSSKDLMDKMKEGGVEGAPSIFYYHVVQKY